MIQRIQSIWLFLAAVCATLSFKFPFYSGNKIEKDKLPSLEKLTASSHFILLVLTVILIVEIVATIFMYKNRKQQLWLTITSVILSLINLVIYFTQIKNYSNGTLSFTAIFVFAVPVLLILSVRGIWKDEKLVKSLDRIR
jgi:drug/metabolite transporter (DMT)-like permease